MMKMPKFRPGHQSVYWLLSGLYACACAGLLDKAVVAGLTAFAYALLAVT
jgi:hypothetical protein